MNNDMDDERLFRIIEQIDDVLTENKADTHGVLTAGVQLIRSAFAQIAYDNPNTDLITLANSITETLNNSLKHIILYPDNEIVS